ncbi:MAG: Stp1/IreP family PP2C-type Ser/Thr phosphatase [Betaproteobacteria bacterium]|nr:Stp1/IreP family PP2C-type Ser/Thr phosphatase [Betaproteobacteria bacterium]
MVSLSDAGTVRSHNEDAVYFNPACGLAILADGMGGYNAGEVASGMVTTLLGGALETAPARQQAQGVLEQEIARVNHAVYQAAQSQAQYAGMGTTLVMAVFQDNAMTVAHIGDSRLYRLRGETFQQITRDHSLLQEQIDSGLLTPQQARLSQNKNLVTRAVGVDPQVTPEIHQYATLPGDIYLFCSDGLNDMVEDDEIGMALQMLAANLELAATQLVQMANDNGGRDNVSVILVRIRSGYPASNGMGGWLKKLLARFK